ncbi:hypothetical protein PIB30_084428 [Stylosanthes scabra]|uniref:Uncharacterized protein n=1 Tax=Stylosanthes scabra TaxID=79078 RepID=A0ABU6YRC4_9FABA|nr:hypothetical protein [Stylosanthes scabra]
MQYPKEEDKDGCMQIDIIEELIREVQQEEAMTKLQAKHARYDDLDNSNHNFVMQKIVKEVQKIPIEVQKSSTNVQNFGGNIPKKVKSGYEGSSPKGGHEAMGRGDHLPHFR